MKKRQQLRSRVFAVAGLFLSLLLVLAVVGFTLSHKVAKLQAHVGELQKKKNSYQPILNEIDKLIKDKKNLERKLDIIAELKKGSQKTVRVVDEFARLTPSERLWLTSLKLAPAQLQISAIALDNATIAQYMEIIKASKYFTGATLPSSSQAVIAGQKLKSFSLRIGVN